jgi:hypothetical protein
MAKILSHSESVVSSNTMSIKKTGKIKVYFGDIQVSILMSLLNYKVLTVYVRMEFFCGNVISDSYCFCVLCTSAKGYSVSTEIK